MIIVLGVTTAIVPFLGFPTSWKNVILPIIGLTIAVLAYRLLPFAYKENSEVEFEDDRTESYQYTSEAVIAHE